MLHRTIVHLVPDLDHTQHGVMVWMVVACVVMMKSDCGGVQSIVGPITPSAIPRAVKPFEMVLHLE